MESNISNIIWDLEHVWSYMGEDLRNEILKSLSQIPLPTNNFGDKTDVSFSVDFSNDRYRHGDRCVYACVTETTDLFYIGQGQRERPLDMHSRNKSFLDVTHSHDIKVYILAANVHKSYSPLIETLCIYLAQLKGWSLKSNRNKRLTDSQIALIREKKPCKVFDTLCEYLSNFPEIEGQFNEFNSFLLDTLLSDSGMINDNLLPTSHKPLNRHQCWRVDGVVDYAVNWCKQYKISYSAVMNRISQGLTLKEALSFPKVPNGLSSHRRAEYWDSLGLYPGTDRTAEIIGRLSDDEIATLRIS